MSYIFTALVFLIIFSILILVHEFGHFIMAKRAGIKVEEFGFGLPPRLWGKKKGETIYSINWIPFGGFVRMYGEDHANTKMFKSDRSFVAKPIRARVKVVVAGVMMNFLLAWMLMIVGFSVGMQPLLGPGDVLGAVNDGKIVLETGAKVKSVKEGSLPVKLGIKAEDILYTFNDKKVNDFVLAGIFKNPVGKYQIIRGQEILNFQVDEQMFKAGINPFEVELYDVAAFPRVKIFNLSPYTQAYQSGLRADDVILSVNGEQIYSIEDYEDIIRGVETLEYKIYRNGFVQTFVVQRDDLKRVIISEILPDTPAEKAGIEAGDIVVSVNGVEMVDGLQLMDFVKKHKEEELTYLIDRNGRKLFYKIKPEKGRIGVLLSELISHKIDQDDISLYNVDLFSSIVEVKDEKYPVHVAVYKALGETWRLSKITAQMFTGFVGSLVSNGEVPESVAGPVGIAQMTHIFVQEGFIPLLRFVAILSLSLAVINILPFPALDGGRLLFLVVEFVIGRRVNQRWESYIHAFGYLLILLLIIAVTYSDVLKLIRG